MAADIKGVQEHMNTTITRIILALSALAALAAVPSAQAGSIDDFDAYRPIWGMIVQPYRLYVPRNYDPRHSYPLILSLHGMGCFGQDNVSQMVCGQTNIEDMVANTQYDCFIMAPQIGGDIGWDWNSDAQFGRVITVLDMMRRKYNIDAQRLYLTGCSMGGNGTWWAGDHYAQYFACAVPLAGWYDTGRASHYVTKPLWVFHGGSDGTVNKSSDIAMIAAIKALGGNPLYTEYPGAGHVIWPTVYTEPSLYPWMFSKVLPTPAPRIHGPLLAYDRESLGGGRYRYTFRIDNDDNVLDAYGLTVAFQGIDGAVIEQAKFYGAVNADTEEQATQWDGLGTPPYHKSDDSWFCEPWVSHSRADANPIDGTMFQGIAQGANSYCITATGGSSDLGTGVPVAQIVATGAVSWTGTIDRGLFPKLVLRGETEPADAVEDTILGDFNNDGVVDIGDYTTWADHFDMDRAATLAPGSYLSPGTVDIGDYTTWADHFGNTRTMTVAQPDAPAVVTAAQADTPTATAADATTRPDEGRCSPSPRRIQARQERQARRAAARAAK